VIEHARERNLVRIRLECIDGNDGARALYDGLGFAALRTLAFFDGVATERLPAGHNVSDLASPTSLWTDFAAYHRHRRPWQQDAPSLELVRDATSLPGLGLGDPTRPDSYLIYRAPAEPQGRLAIVDTGSLHQDDPGGLAALLGAALSRHPSASVFAPNVPEDDPFHAALRRAGVPIRLTQTEMALEL
jgi:hypothetical protein